MTAQLHLDVLEWIDAGEATLKNVGGFGRGYDRTKVERFQKANNVLTGVAINGAGAPAVQRITVDGLWGPETANALKTLLKRLPSSLFPSANPETFRLSQWQNAGIQAEIVRVLTLRRQELEAAMAAAATSSPVPNATQAASQEAQAAVAAAHDALTEPAAPGPTPIQPPPDEAAPGPQPPSGARAPIRLADERVLGTRYRKSGTDIPWFSIGLGVLAFASVIGWAAYRKRRRAQ